MSSEIRKLPTLYKRDSKQSIRIWYMELDGSNYRTFAGLEEGQLVTSEWTKAIPKNVGRANVTTATEQANAEAVAIYKKKLDVDYHTTVDTIDTPKIFKPMLATTWEKRKDKIKYTSPVYVQPKLDGIRCIATRFGLFSRTGKPITAVPHIMTALLPVFDDHPDAVFDGELYNHDLRDDFNSIVSMVRKSKSSAEDLELSARLVEYHIYDYPAMMHDIFSLRLNTMCDMLLLKREMKMPIVREGSPIKVVKTMVCKNEETVDQRYGEFIGEGYEGGIIRINDVYQQKRSSFLIKRKDFDDAEFDIVLIKEGIGNWSGAAKIVVLRLENGDTCDAGLAGTYEYLRQVLKEAHEYVNATTQFFGRTPAGKLRFPIVKVLHKTARI